MTSNKQNSVPIDCRNYPLIDKILLRNEKTIISQKTLTLENDHFMQDHCFNNIPIFPGVIGLELFAELATIILPNKLIEKIQDIEFRSAIRLKSNKPKTIRAILSFDDTQANAALSLVDGDIDNINCDSKLCFKATLIFGIRRNSVQAIPSLRKMPLLNQQFIYQILPHGPSFQVLSEINHLDDEVLAIGKYNSKQLFPKKKDNLVIDPLSIEIGFQAIGLFDFVNNNRAGLPSALKQVQFYDFKGKPHFVLGKKKGENDIGSIFDFIVLTKKGDVVLEVSDYQTVEVDLGDTAGILKRIRSHAIRQLVGMPKLAWLEVVSFSLLQDKLSREPDFINEFLNAEELQHANQLDQNARFIYLTEIFALKRALRVVLRTSNMRDLKIMRNTFNEPYYRFKGRQIFLTTTKTDEYVFTMASLKQKYGIAISKRDSKLALPVEEILTKQEIELLEQNKDSALKNELLHKFYLVKQAACKTISDKIQVTDLHQFVIQKHAKNIFSIKFKSENNLQANNINLEVITNQNNIYLTALSKLK